METFAQVIGRLAPEKKIAAGVSGGGDSMALALLLQEAGYDVTALTVDHGLRAESAREAAEVHAALQQRGIAHEILVWEGGKPEARIQERAREARYALLTGWCLARGIGTLAVAHNAEDAAETFWMRLSKGSGLDGLAGMRESVARGGIQIIRPLLGFSRAELRAACGRFGAAWIEDPSNANEKYLRPRLRGFEDALAREGLDAARLGLVMRKLGDARDALQEVAAQAAQACLEGGVLKVDLWRGLHPEIQRRVLAGALGGGRGYPVRFEQIEDLRAALSESPFKGRTLAGFVIGAEKDGRVALQKEA